MIRALLIVLQFWVFAANANVDPSNWISRSHDVFFPTSMSSYIEPYQRFSSFWWGHLVFESPESERDRVLAALCAEIGGPLREFVNRSPCTSGLEGLKPLLTEWAGDIPLRKPAPVTVEFANRIEASIAKASLPGTRDLLWLLRGDPLASYLDLKKHLEEISSSGTDESSRGLIAPPGTNRWAVPIQFKFPPSASLKTKDFLSKFNTNCGPSAACAGAYLVGPHVSVLENETQVHADLDTVSLAGILFLVALSGFLIATRRKRLLLVIFPTIVSTALASVVTIIVFGKIHGLTLSLGSGIIGLAVDYGLHSAFYRYSWRANLFGLLTTLAALGAVAISSVPLLGQMMFFSGVGLIISFLALVLVFKFYDSALRVEPYAYIPHPRPWKLVVSLILIVAGLFGPLLQTLNLDLRQFNFQQSKTAEYQEWIGVQMQNRIPLIGVHPASATLLEVSAKKLNWARENGIRFESMASYLPPVPQQQENLLSWKPLFCPEAVLSLSAQQVEFAEPFLRSIKCNLLMPKDILAIPPKYVEHLYFESSWLELWLPRNKTEEGLIKNKFPEAVSLRELAVLFSKTLNADLAGIIPLAIGGVFLLLLYQFRDWRIALLAAVPCWTGIGMLMLANLFAGGVLTFMTMIAILLIVGFSVDYGIFVTENIFRYEKRDERGVWSSLGISALATAGGFFPLVLGKHPVLFQLGLGLTAGVIGTFIGAAWGIPGLVRYWERKSA